MTNLVLLGFLGSLAAGFMTTLGALPVLVGKAPSEKARDMLLGFAAGVMLAASFFSLIVPSLALSTEHYGEGALPAAIAVAGILLGFIVVATMNALLPHEHFMVGREGPASPALRKVWWFVIAITIHN